ncbi:MAG: hypothetical protein PUC39_05235 [Lachnospiraceae bacterium]|nr:hypothetical protein [Lachnospiraceae bacterium]
MIGVGFYGTNMYMTPLYDTSRVAAVNGVDQVQGSRSLQEGRRVESNSGVSRPIECQTCKNRKYQDGSDESDVSFKAPGHISPEQSASTVMSHELQHVANARQEGAKENKQLLSATVSLKIGVCPECGRTYVAGGETNTTIKTTYNEQNPYDAARKTIEGSFLSGMNLDLSA